MIGVPARFWDVPYNGKNYPGASSTSGLEGGANCQQYAYEFLRHHGRKVPEFRSNALWEDEWHTRRVTEFEPLDLLLFNRTNEARGAHVAVYLGEARALHLCKSLGRPAIWTLPEFLARPEYRILLGAKRVT